MNKIEVKEIGIIRHYDEEREEIERSINRGEDTYRYLLQKENLILLLKGFFAAAAIYLPAMLLLPPAFAVFIVGGTGLVIIAISAFVEPQKEGGNRVANAIRRLVSKFYSSYDHHIKKRMMLKCKKYGINADPDVYENYNEYEELKSLLLNNSMNVSIIPPSQVDLIINGRIVDRKEMAQYDYEPIVAKIKADGVKKGDIQVFDFDTEDKAQAIEEEIYRQDISPFTLYDNISIQKIDDLEKLKRKLEQLPLSRYRQILNSYSGTNKNDNLADIFGDKASMYEKGVAKIYRPSSENISEVV